MSAKTTKKKHSYNLEAIQAPHALEPFGHSCWGNCYCNGCYNL